MSKHMHASNKPFQSLEHKEDDPMMHRTRHTLSQSLPQVPPVPFPLPMERPHIHPNDIGCELGELVSPFYPSLNGSSQPKTKGKILSIPTVTVNPGQVSAAGFAPYISYQLRTNPFIRESGGLFKIEGLCKWPKKKTNKTMYDCVRNLKKQTVLAMGSKIKAEEDGCILLEQFDYKKKNIQKYVDIKAKADSKNLGWMEMHDQFVKELRQVKDCKQNQYYLVEDPNFTAYRASDIFQMNELMDHGPLKFIPRDFRFAIVNQNVIQNVTQNVIHFFKKIHAHTQKK